MKNQMFTSLIACGFAAILGSIPAAAQPRQTATIPFTFEVSGVEYPEGHYSVQSLGSSRVLVIRNLDTGRAALLNTPILAAESEPTSPKLVFTRTSDHLKLSEVWFAGHPGMLTAVRGKEVSARVAVVLK